MKITISRKQLLLIISVIALISLACMIICASVIGFQYINNKNNQQSTSQYNYYNDDPDQVTTSYPVDSVQNSEINEDLFRKPIADFEGDKFTEEIQITSDSNCEEKIILGTSGAYICKNKFKKVSEQDDFETCFNKVKNSEYYKYYDQANVNTQINNFVYEYEIIDSYNKTLATKYSSVLDSDCQVSFTNFIDKPFYGVSEESKNKYLVTSDGLLLIRESKCDFLPYECHPNEKDTFLDLKKGTLTSLSVEPFYSVYEGKFYAILKKISKDRIVVIPKNIVNQKYKEGVFNIEVYIYSFPEGKLIDQELFTLDKYDVPREYGEVGTFDDVNMYYFFNSYEISKVQIEVEDESMYIKLELSLKENNCTDGKPKCSVNLIPGMSLRRELRFY